MSATKKLSDAERIPIKNQIQAYALDCLEDSRTRVKQLYEILRKVDDKFLATPSVVDRVGELMDDEERYVRVLAINVYAELLKKNPELATKERRDKFLELREHGDPRVRETFLKRLMTPVKGLEEWDYETRKKVFEWLMDPDVGVRKEAREAVQRKFGISSDISKSIVENMLARFTFNQTRDTLLLMESLAGELGKTKLDASAVFSNAGEIIKGIDKHEFGDLKFTMHMAKNLLGGEGSAEEYNECLRLCYKLYREIGDKVGVGSEAWGSILGKVFVDWIPDVAREMGYGHLSMGLEKLVEEVKSSKPEELTRRELLEVLKYGKASS